MDAGVERKLVLVTRQTRLEGLIGRFHTLAQAKFYIEHQELDFSDYEREHNAYVQARRVVLAILRSYGRHQVVDRSFLPNFVFSESDIVLALGQDGLVANTMKYLDGQPLLGINPEPSRYDGVLLACEPQGVAESVAGILRGRFIAKEVTMAKATLTNGQTLYGVNDLFIGPRSHVSARYEIELDGQREIQSSSGLIVSTGLGSTAWMKSIVVGALQIAAMYDEKPEQREYRPIPWDADKLVFAVREPFPSKASGATIVYGSIADRHPLKLTSLMPADGVIFSDGIESDFLEFNSGAVASIDVAERKGILVV